MVFAVAGDDVAVAVSAPCSLHCICMHCLYFPFFYVIIVRNIEETKYNYFFKIVFLIPHIGCGAGPGLCAVGARWPYLNVS